MSTPIDYREVLLVVARAYGRATNRSLARVSTLVRGHGAFLDRLSAGQGCTVDTFLQVLDWFWTNWPDDTAWPAGVVTPAQIESIGIAMPQRRSAAA